MKPVLDVTSTAFLYLGCAGRQFDVRCPQQPCLGGHRQRAVQLRVCRLAAGCRRALDPAVHVALHIHRLCLCSRVSGGGDRGGRPPVRADAAASCRGTAARACSAAPPPPAWALSCAAKRSEQDRRGECAAADGILRILECDAEVLHALRTPARMSTGGATSEASLKLSVKLLEDGRSR